MYSTAITWTLYENSLLRTLASTARAWVLASEEDGSVTLFWAWTVGGLPKPVAVAMGIMWRWCGVATMAVLTCAAVSPDSGGRPVLPPGVFSVEEGAICCEKEPFLSIFFPSLSKLKLPWPLASSLGFDLEWLGATECAESAFLPLGSEVEEVGGFKTLSSTTSNSSSSEQRAVTVEPAAMLSVSHNLWVRSCVCVCVCVCVLWYCGNNY